MMKKEDYYVIKNSDYVDLYYMGNVYKVRYLAKRNNRCAILRIDNDNYVHIATGEVLPFKHIANRTNDIKSISKSLERLRDYLNTNITDVDKCRWITLTYAENMTDSKRLYGDYKKFWQRFVYWCNNQGYSKPEYIIAAEPQGRGAWHLHCVFIFPHTAPFISNKVLRKLWRQGFVTIKKLDDVDNVGAYLTAYLGDMDLDEWKKDKSNTKWCGNVKEVEVECNGQKIKKKFLKGARLHYYPPKFNLYRCSRGIKKPKIETLTYFEAKQKVSTATLTFRSSVLFSDDDSNFENIIVKEYYNSQRK